MIEHRKQLTELVSGGIGVELGVAGAGFSLQLLDSSLDLLFSVDDWARGKHRDPEAEIALERLQKHKFRSCVLRMTFEQAAGLFADETFDLIYIDGMAQFGCAKTIQQWWPKCKAGGIFAGHDYHERWPRVIRDVDAFVAQHELELNLTKVDRYPSWWVRK